MKTKSVILLLAGIAIGAIGGYLLTPPKGKRKRRKELLNKSKKYKKAFQVTASKYREKLGNL